MLQTLPAKVTDRRIAQWAWRVQIMIGRALLAHRCDFVQQHPDSLWKIAIH